MKRTLRSHWLSYAMLGAGSLFAWCTAISRRKRRRLLQNGEIHALHDHWTDVCGLRMYARVSTAAAGPETDPIVFVHGWSISGDYFIPAAERLASRFPVYVPDLPGHGKSDTPPEPLDVPGLARALVDWMDCAGIERAVLVGQSLGCQVAVEAALQCPSRVTRLVLIGITLDPAARSVVQQAGRLLMDGAFEHPLLYPQVAKDYLRMGMRAIPELRFMLEDPIVGKLLKVNLPTMLIRGENDPVVPERWFDSAARLLGTSRKIVVPRWGHAVQFSAPKQFADAIRPFLVEKR